jgi:putative integral membrane protein (TIGR02587 family)
MPVLSLCAKGRRQALPSRVVAGKETRRMAKAGLGDELRYLKALGRAFGGALLFSLPLFMTMEMWQFGFSMDRLKLALFLFVNLGVLLGASYYSGFEETFCLKDEVLDALAAFAVGVVCSVVMLSLFEEMTPDMGLPEITGKIALCAIPGSLGAILAGKQMGAQQDGEERAKREATFGGELFLMSVGAAFFAFNVAPTEEMIVIAYQITPLHAAALMLLSVLTLYALVYGVGLAGQEERPEGAGFWGTFALYTLTGYGVSLAVSAATLWVFDRLVSVSPATAAATVIVLGFPAAIGAATARLVL